MAYTLTKEEYAALKKAKTNYNALQRQTVYNHPETKEAFEQINEALDNIQQMRINTLAKSFATKEEYERTLKTFQGLKGRTKTVTQETGEKTIEFTHFLFQEARKAEEKIKAEKAKLIDPSAYKGTETVLVNANLMPKKLETKEEIEKKELQKLLKQLKKAEKRSKVRYWKEQDRIYKENFKKAIKNAWGSTISDVIIPYIDKAAATELSLYALSVGGRDIASVYTEAFGGTDLIPYITRMAQGLVDYGALTEEQADEMISKVTEKSGFVESELKYYEGT